MDEAYSYACGLLYHVGSRQVLLHHRDANAPTNPNTWALIGGGREPEDGGDPVLTWMREVEEEIGVVLERDLIRFLADYLKPGTRRRRCVFYYEWPSLDTEFVIGEGDGVGWVTVEEALALPDVTAGTKQDLVTFVSELNVSVVPSGAAVS